jgi:DNA-binding NarL/FixJ family response regulator
VTTPTLGLPLPLLTDVGTGERLFLSHRTVASHVYRIYPKLGIAARGQLRESLAIGARD